MFTENLLSKNIVKMPSALAQIYSGSASKKTYRHEIEICLKDSNAYGNTYFARYFEWQGICREQWFRHCVADDLLQSQGVFVTKCAHQSYVSETFPFQAVECLLNTFCIKSCSFHILFRFFVDGGLVSMGYQQIVFANHDKKIVRLPEAVIANIKRYEEPLVKLQE